MSITVSIVIMVICLLAEGFFSGSELGVVSADPMKLRHKAAQGSKGARLTLAMLEKPEWLLSTTLVGTNIAVVTNTTVATALMIQLFGDKGSYLAIILVAPLIWVLGEIVPKSVFQQKTDTLTPIAIFALRGASIIFFPILIIFTTLTSLLARTMGKSKQSPFTLREEIKTMIQMSPPEGDIQPIEQSMIKRLFDFHETSAREVMIPWLDATAIEESVTAGEATRIAATSSHQRLPVYSGRIDRVVGILDTLELLGRDAELPIKDFIRPCDYVPGSRSIRDLLADMRLTEHAMSIVVDEFGGAEGIVTLEDIVEEVVEEIEDEFDTEQVTSQVIRRLGERNYAVSARIELDTLKEALHIDLPSGKYATLSGFLLEIVRDIPTVGETVQYKDISFIIHRATPRAIQEVHIRW